MAMALAVMSMTLRFLPDTCFGDSAAFACADACNTTIYIGLNRADPVHLIVIPPAYASPGVS